MTKRKQARKNDVIKRIASVDSGQLLIIDPAYLEDLTPADLEILENDIVKQIDHVPDTPGKGVLICRTGLGDGNYAVDIETFDDDGYTRVKSIKIDFLKPGWTMGN